jgi:hypothetical protein
MSRNGCWDNAVAESFFSSLKKERIKKQIYKNRELAKADVADNLDSFYNRTRRRSHLGGLSPEQFEAAHNPAPRSPPNRGNSTLALLDNRSPHVYDYVTGVCPFSVRQDRKEVGVVRMAHSWERPSTP